MLKSTRWLIVLALPLLLTACSTYKAQPLPFKAADSYPNRQHLTDMNLTIGSQAFSDRKQAREAFGFDIRGAGMLPVQVVFDNQSNHPLQIIPEQTFLVDSHGNLWPVLEDRFARERAVKWAGTKKIFQEGAYGGFLGAAGGALIGAAIGVASGHNVGEAAGVGGALGLAAGATAGGVHGASEGDYVRHQIVTDLKAKSLQNRPVPPYGIANGIIFFPGESPDARQLRLMLREEDTGNVKTITMDL